MRSKFLVAALFFLVFFLGDLGFVTGVGLKSRGVTQSVGGAKRSALRSGVANGETSGVSNSFYCLASVAGGF